ncbi:hypothetical protein ACTPEM_22880, partial [Clostridioides difficile]
PIEIELSPQQANLIGCVPSAVYSSRDLILLLNSEQEVINYKPSLFITISIYLLSSHLLSSYLIYLFLYQFTYYHLNSFDYYHLLY